LRRLCARRYEEFLERCSVQLKIGDGEKRIHEEHSMCNPRQETNDSGAGQDTRNNGGGHANLFTRDIFKAISVAHENDYECLPVIIAESWGGDLKSLHCEALDLSSRQSEPDRGHWPDARKGSGKAGPFSGVCLIHARPKASWLSQGASWRWRSYSSLQSIPDKVTPELLAHDGQCRCRQRVEHQIIWPGRGP